MRNYTEHWIIDFAYSHGMLYATTHREAARHKVIAAPIASFNAATARTVVPTGERVLGLVGAARDTLYFEVREANAKQLWRLPYRRGAIADPVAPPLEGGFNLRQRGAVWAAHPRLDGLAIALETAANAPQIYTFPAKGEVFKPVCSQSAFSTIPPMSRRLRCWSPATTA